MTNREPVATFFVAGQRHDYAGNDGLLAPDVELTDLPLYPQGCSTSDVALVLRADRVAAPTGASAALQDRQTGGGAIRARYETRYQLCAKPNQQRPLKLRAKQGGIRFALPLEASTHGIAAEHSIFMPSAQRR